MTSYQLVVAVHILAAVTWVGGVLFIGSTFIPATRQLDEAQRRQIISATGRRFRAVGWSALAVLVVTGVYLMGTWGARIGTVWDGSFFDSPRTRTLQLKLMMFGLMIAVSGWHDWYLGPKVTRLARRGESVTSLRSWATVLGQCTALLAVGVVILAAMMVRAGAR